MVEKPLVSVVVPTRNSAATLEACLKSIKRQSYSSVELIVVDNNSSDGTRDIARYFADLVLVKGPERSAQRNCGADSANGAFLLMIDSDMELDERVIESCVECAIANPEFGGVVIPEESFGEGFWSQCKKLERSFYVGVPWLEAARFFGKFVYATVGGYNERLISGEDWDLSMRIEQVGMLYRTSEYIRHYEGRVTLWGTLRKKYYYAQHARAFLSCNPQNSKISAKVGPIERYKLFFSRPDRLFERPVLGLGMLFMKTCEFAFGGLGFVFSWRH